MPSRILVVHGPNLNLLGERQPEIYGRLTLRAVNGMIRRHAAIHGASIRVFQSNHEGALVDFIHTNRRWADAIVINPGALTHYSYTLRDAIAAVGIPTVEVHLSDVNHRESFRQRSVIRPVCVDRISGLGAQSYIRAIDVLIDILHRPPPTRSGM